MNHSLLRGRQLAAALFALMGALSISSLHAAKPAQPGNGKGNGGNGNAGVCTFSGRAIALQIDGVVHPTPGQILVADTGPLPAAGGHLLVTVSDFSYGGGGLTIDEASAMTSGGGRQTLSTSMLSGFRVEFVESDSGQEHHAVIEADFIYGEASATVAKNGQITLAGKVDIQGLKVNGEPVTVTGQPNQRVELPPEMGGYLILNVQSHTSGPNGGSISVTPIVFHVCHCIDGHIGRVDAGIKCDGNPPPSDGDCGKVTGGGWIVTPSGAKGTFGMSGGIRRGEFWGHLTYNDHGIGLKVHSTAVIGFELDPTDANGRIITYAVTINGSAGTARLRVVDNGEPGRDDIFDLTLSTGYHASGDLGGGRPGGGNIQLHKCPPGWE